MLSLAARRFAQSAPRGARAASTMRTTATANAPVTPVAQQNKAGITTNAKSLSNPAPAASSHVKSTDGRVKSASRHFHAIGSESTAGLNEPIGGAAAARQAAKLRRMRDAKDMAGLV